MIKKFKLFLESIDADDSIIEISVDEYMEQFDLDSIYMDQAFLDELNIALGRTSPDLILKIATGEKTAFNYPHNEEMISMFVDNDYWLYIEYEIMQISASGAHIESYLTLYYKIDISEGVVHIPEYLRIVEQKRIIK